MSSNPVATDLRARKSTIVIAALATIYAFLEMVWACAHAAVQTHALQVTHAGAESHDRIVWYFLRRR